MSAILADNGLPGLDRVGVWFNDPSNWHQLLQQVRGHLLYTLIIVGAALLIGLPIGLLIGHTGRGVFLAAGLANGLRAVPTIGLVILLSVWLSPKIHGKGQIPWLTDRGGLANFLAMLIGLIVLALPPILTNTYAGVQNVDPEVRDAARGMGMTGWQVVRQVEIPNALPLIMSGLRSATLQVIATVAVAAYLPFLGGLGSYIRDGIGTLNDPQTGYPAMVAAGVVVAVLAVLVDLLLNGVQRLVVSPGVSGRFAKRSAAPGTDVPLEAQLTEA